MGLVMLLLLLETTTTTAAALAEFAAIGGGLLLNPEDQSKVQGIRLPPKCPRSSSSSSGGGSDDLDDYTTTTSLQVPTDVEYTILPSSTDAIFVLTSPANLVTTRLNKNNNMMELEWNADVLKALSPVQQQQPQPQNASVTTSSISATNTTNTTGTNTTITSSAAAEESSLSLLFSFGIVIQIPNRQFQSLESCCHAQTQVLEGFTNVQSFILSSGSETRAIIFTPSSTSTTSTTTNADTDSDTDDTASTNPPTLPGIQISSGAKATIEGNEFDTIVASSEAELRLKGNITTSLRAESAASIVWQGSMSSSSTTTNDAKTTWSLSSAASLLVIITTTLDDDQDQDICNAIEVADDASCNTTSTSTTNTQQTVNAFSDFVLALEDNGNRTTCLQSPFPESTASSSSPSPSSSLRTIGGVPLSIRFLAAVAAAAAGTAWIVF